MASYIYKAYDLINGFTLSILQMFWSLYLNRNLHSFKCRKKVELLTSLNLAMQFFE